MTLATISHRIAHFAAVFVFALAGGLVATATLLGMADSAQAQHRLASGSLDTSPEVTTAGIIAEARGGGSQDIRVRLVQDDNTVNGTFTLAIDARTDGLAANTFGSATVDIRFDPALLSPSGAALGVLDYFNTPYVLIPSIIGGGTVFRTTITSQNVGTGGFPERDGYEIGNSFEPIATLSFTITAPFDESDFPVNCFSLSVGYYDSVDNSSGSGIILESSSGAVPMASVRPLALRTLDLTAEEGWRTLSGLPGMTVDDLFGQLTTRGFPQATNETGFPNVWRWNEDAGWIAAASQSDLLPATDGVAFFALAADLPASVRVSGPFADQGYDSSTKTCSAFPIAFDVSFTDPGSTGFAPGWNLVGNPTAGTLDWKVAGWTRTNLTNIAYVYDAVSDQYLTHNGTIGTLGFDGLIAPLQGFWVKATGVPVLEAPEAALTTGGSFYGRLADAQSGAFVLADAEVNVDNNISAEVLPGEGSARSTRGAVFALRVTGEVGGTERWAEAYVSFQGGGEADLDRYDAEALAGLGNASLDLYTVLGDGTALEIDARPFVALSAEDLEIPLAVEAIAGGEPIGGKFTLSLTEAVRLPGGVRPVLVDTETGAEIDFSNTQTYSFELAATPLSAAASREVTASRETAAFSRHEASLEAPMARVKTASGSKDANVPKLGVPVAQRGDASGARFLLRFETSGKSASRSASNADKASENSLSGTEQEAGLASARGAGTSLPEAYALESIYPNPFAGMASVRYALPEAAAVRLVAYDLLGRRMAVLVDEAQTAGYHTATWEASGLPSGVYILRLVAGEHTFAERITLVR